MDYKDYYQTLGVSRTATQAEIKKAFRKLARQGHPDVKPGDKSAEQRFKEINEANEVLSDPKKRKQYDELGANWEAYTQAGSGGRLLTPFGAGRPFAGFGESGRQAGGQGGVGGVRYEFRSAGGEDLGDFSDFFQAFFGAEAEPVATSAQTSRPDDERPLWRLDRRRPDDRGSPRGDERIRRGDPALPNTGGRSRPGAGAGRRQPL